MKKIPISKTQISIEKVNILQILQNKEILAKFEFRIMIDLYEKNEVGDQFDHRLKNGGNRIKSM